MSTPMPPNPSPSLTYHCICGHSKVEHEPDCVFCKCEKYQPLIHPAEPAPISPTELRRIANGLDPNKNPPPFGERDHYPARLRMLADWLEKR